MFPINSDRGTKEEKKEGKEGGGIHARRSGGTLNGREQYVVTFHDDRGVAFAPTTRTF